MSDKFNAFNNAKNEANQNEDLKPAAIRPRKRERKSEQLTIVLTPTNKNRIREIADSVGMSISELIAYWVENQK